MATRPEPDPDLDRARAALSPQTEAWLVRVPERADARYVTIDRGWAISYATKLHGIISELVDRAWAANEIRELEKRIELLEAMIKS